MLKTILHSRIIFQFLLVIAFGSQLIYAQDLEEGKTVNLKLAVPFRLFDDLTRKDAQLAMDMWTKEIVQSVKETNDLHFIVSSTFLENEYEKVDFSEHQKYDILLLTIIDFFDYGLDRYWDPIALTTVKGRFPEEYIILSKKDKKYKDIHDLKDKSITFTKHLDARIIQFWMHNLFQEQQLGVMGVFFGSIEKVKNDSKAILSVFFNKVNACIVGYNQFQTMIELNPQIGRDLEILVESPPFARGMVGLKKTMDKQVKEIVNGAVLELPNSQRGKQILNYFGQSDLIPYQSKYMNTIRELVRSSKKIESRK